MNKSAHMEHATLDVTMSFLVKAKSRPQACAMAEFLLNEDNVLLDGIGLVNDQGSKREGKVERLESIQWSCANSFDFSNQYKVVGQIRLWLTLDGGHDREGEDRSPLGAYRLPVSPFLAKTVWVIPTRYEPIFTHVISHSLERHEETPESASFNKAG